MTNIHQSAEVDRALSATSFGTGTIYTDVLDCSEYDEIEAIVAAGADVSAAPVFTLQTCDTSAGTFVDSVADVSVGADSGIASLGVRRPHRRFIRGKVDRPAPGSNLDCTIVVRSKAAKEPVPQEGSEQAKFINVLVDA